MKVKNLTVVRLTEWHEKAASSKLTVVYDYNTLEHMVVEAFRHPIKGPHIVIESTDDVKIASRTKVGGERQIGSIIADRRG